MTAVAQNQPRWVEALLKSGHDVNFVVPFNGQTALMRAVQVGNKEMVELLMKAGADPTLKAKDGRYALQFFNIRAENHEYRDVLAQRMIQQLNDMSVFGDLDKQKKANAYLLALKAYVHAAGTKYFNSMAEKFASESPKPKASASAARSATKTPASVKKELIAIQEDPVWKTLMYYYNSSLMKTARARSAVVRSAPAVLHRQPSARAPMIPKPLDMPPTVRKSALMRKNIPLIAPAPPKTTVAEAAGGAAKKTRTKK
jgi:hypothetical protein